MNLWSVEKVKRFLPICVIGLFVSFPISKASIEIFSVLSIGVTLFLFFQDKQNRNYLSKLDLFLAFFIFANLISVLMSDVFLLSLRAFFSKLLEAVFLYYVGYFSFIWLKNDRTFLRYVFLLCLVMAGVVLSQYFFNFEPIRGRALHKGIYATGTFYNPNDFAGWLTLILFPLFAYFYQKKKMFLEEPKKSILYVSVFFVMVLAFFMTDSRGAWFGLFIGFLFLAYAMVQQKLSFPLKWIFGGGVLVLIFAGLILSFVNVSLSQILYDKADYLLSGRLTLWEGSFEMISASPIWGVGLNTYAKLFQYYHSLPEVMYPHNSFLQMGAEVGLLGLFAFLLFLYASFRHAVVAYLKGKDLFVLGIAAGCVSFLGHSFLDTNLYSLPLVSFFWFTLGYLRYKSEGHQ